MLWFPKAKAEYALIKADTQTNMRAIAENKAVEYRNQMLEYQGRCHELEARLAEKEQDRIRIQEDLQVRERTYRPMQQTIYLLYK